MSRGNHQRFRRRLEQQLRADVELLVAACRTKLCAYETLARSRGELNSEPETWALELPADLLATLTGTAPSSSARTPAPPRSAAPALRSRAGALTLRRAVDQALRQVGETFDRNDLCRELGFEPPRSSLHRVLLDLEREKAIATARIGHGRTPARYRKLP